MDDAVLDIDHAGEDASGEDHELGWAGGVGEDLKELDPHDGDLRLESSDVQGLLEGLLLLRC